MVEADDNLKGIARAFVAARRAGEALAAYPGDRPAGLAAAYAVQDEAIALFAEPIGGWKVGRINPPIDGIDRLAGPIFARQIVVASDKPPAMPIFADGFGAAEAEFLLRIGTAPDPAKTNYTNEEAAALIDAVHVGIEVASSPYPGINADGAFVTISDFGNNNGLVVGPAITDWRDHDLNDWLIELDIDRRLIGSKTAASMLDGPFGAARFLFEHMAARGIALEAGQWISSGAVTGVHQVGVGASVECRFGDDYRVACTISAQ